MKLMKLTATVVLFLACWSCRTNSPQSVEAAYLSSVIERLEIRDDYKWVVILPGLGCHGCIQEGEAFAKENISNKSILFVLTNIESMKLLRNKIGVDLKAQRNVIIDDKNEINIPTDNKIYPCIIQLTDRKLSRHEFQSPQNGAAFRELESRLKTGF